MTDEEKIESLLQYFRDGTRGIKSELVLEVIALARIGSGVKPRPIQLWFDVENAVAVFGDGKWWKPKGGFSCIENNWYFAPKDEHRCFVVSEYMALSALPQPTQPEPTP